MVLDYMTTAPGLVATLGLLYMVVGTLKLLRDEYRLWRRTSD